MYTDDERAALLESYARAYDLLMEFLPTLPKEMWQFKPEPHRWSVHEILVHITDSEANSYIRCRRMIAEPGQAVMAYDENIWARTLRYHDLDIEDSLELFRLLRRASYTIIKDLPEETWSNTIYHPENGIMTMEDWLYTYERHVPVHIAQMERNLTAWENR